MRVPVWGARVEGHFPTPPLRRVREGELELESEYALKFPNPMAKGPLSYF